MTRRTRSRSRAAAQTRTTSRSSFCFLRQCAQLARDDDERRQRRASRGLELLHETAERRQLVRCAPLAPRETPARHAQVHRDALERPLRPRIGIRGGGELRIEPCEVDVLRELVARRRPLSSRPVARASVATSSMLGSHGDGELARRRARQPASSKPAPDGRRFRPGASEPLAQGGARAQLPARAPRRPSRGPRRCVAHQHPQRRPPADPRARAGLVISSVGVVCPAIAAASSSPCASRYAIRSRDTRRPPRVRRSRPMHERRRHFRWTRQFTISEMTISRRSRCARIASAKSSRIRPGK